MPLNYPPTVVIRHPKENPKKCSILPLKGRADLFFLIHPVKQLPALEGYVCLSADGPPLTEADSDAGLLLLDGSWRRVQNLQRGVTDIPARSLHGYRTAYPRVSSLGTDPGNGLASVEALYVAYRILGRQTEGLLEHYYWAEEFLKRNGWVEREEKPAAE
jgi:pre-rRNA-processing protein TSR3